MTQRLFILLLILIILISATVYTSRDQLPHLWPKTTASPSPSFNPFPLPLQASLQKTPGNLTTAGILSATNQHRIQANLPTLNLNPKLTQIAHYKLDDMFSSQYFGHTNIAGYNNTAIGANLISGNFTDDNDLVQTWMNTPSHRANILNPAYALVGLAAKPGPLNGQQTWLAIQIFAQPPPLTTE